MYDVSSTHVSQLISEAFKYSHIVLASVTYNLGIYPAMHDFLMDMKALNLQKMCIRDSFYADWCGPCKMLAPVLHEIAEENAGALKVGKINVDEQMELAMRFQVSSIPMLVVFKDGKAVAKSVGYRPKSEIAAMVEGAR